MGQRRFPASYSSVLSPGWSPFCRFWSSLKPAAGSPPQGQPLGEDETVEELTMLLCYLSKFMGELPESMAEQLARQLRIQEFPLGHVRRRLAVLHVSTPVRGPDADIPASASCCQGPLCGSHAQKILTVYHVGAGCMLSAACPAA